MLTITTKGNESKDNINTIKSSDNNSPIKVGSISDTTVLNKDIIKKSLKVKKTVKSNKTKQLTESNVKQPLILQSDVTSKSTKVDGGKVLPPKLQVVTLTFPRQEGTEFSVPIPNFQPNGYSSEVNKRLYDFESIKSNQSFAFKEAVRLHGGDPINTCVFFQSSCLRAIGQEVPYNVGYTSVLWTWLSNNGWVRETNFNLLQKGDIVFAGTYHTFMFMGWENKAEGKAYVMGNEAYTEGSDYHHRNLNGQVASPSNDWSNQYKATMFYRYPGTQIPGNGSSGNSSSPYDSENGTSSNVPVIGHGTLSYGTTMWSNPTSQAGTGSINLGTISGGTTVSVTGYHNGFARIKLASGRLVWIDRNAITNYSGSQSQTSIGTATVTATGGLWLNANPSIDNPQNIEVMPNDSTVQVIQRGTTWTEVSYQGTTGWAYTPYLTFSKTEQIQSMNEKGTINAEGGLWLNTNPSLQNPQSILVVPNQTTVKITGKLGDWYKVNYNGQIGWMYSKYIKLQSNSKISLNTSVNGIADTTQDVCLNNLPTTTASGATAITVLQSGTQVKVLGEIGNWYKVDCNGAIGYIEKEYLTDVTKPIPNGWNGNKYYEDNRPLSGWQWISGYWRYFNPNNNDNCIKGSTVINGEHFLFDNNGAMYSGHIDINGVYYNIDNVTHTSELAPQVVPSSGLIKTNETISLNSEPETTENGSTSVTVINENTILTVTGKIGSWYRVTYNGQVGYVESSYVSKYVKNTGWVNGAYYNQQGTELFGWQWIGGYWRYLNPNDGIAETGLQIINGRPHLFDDNGAMYSGFVHTSKGVIYTDNVTHITYIGSKVIGGISYNFGSNGYLTDSINNSEYVNSPNGLWLNGNPSFDDPDNITVLSYGTRVEVLGTQGDWIHVSVNGQQGWCFSTYLQSTSISDNTEVGTINADGGLWLLGSPSFGGSNIEVIPNSSQVTILGSVGDWYKVNYNGTTGYSYSAYISVS